MKVEKVSAHIRYSKALDDGQWKAIELSAEGTVDTRETWQGALSYLYAELGQELRTLWSSNGNGAKQSGNGHQMDTAPPKPAGLTTTTQEHFCETHQVAYQRKRKDGKTWYSHKAPDDEWCNEK